MTDPTALTPEQLRALRAVYQRHGSRKRPRGSTTKLFDIGGGKRLPFEAAHKELLLRHALKADLACDADAVEALPAAVQWDAYRLFVVLPRDVETMQTAYHTAEWSDEEEDVHVPEYLCFAQLMEIRDAVSSDDDTFIVGRKTIRGGVDMMVAVMKSVGYQPVRPVTTMLYTHRTHPEAYPDVDFSKEICIKDLSTELLRALYKVISLKTRMVQRRRSMRSAMGHNEILLKKKAQASGRIADILGEANAAAEKREQVRLREAKEELDMFAQWM